METSHAPRAACILRYPLFPVSGLPCEILDFSGSAQGAIYLTNSCILILESS